MADTPAWQAALLPETPPELRAAAVPLADLPPDEELLGPAPDPALVASVRRHGVLQPILLVRAADGTLAVAEGRRRVKAARLAALSSIPAVIAEGEATLAAAVGLVAHGTRRPNPVADLAAVERLLAAGAAEPAIARATGLTIATLRQRRRLGALDAGLRAALERGRVAVGVAEQAAKLPAAAQRRLAERFEDGGKVTAADVAAERRVRTEAATAVLPFARLTAAVPERATEGEDAGGRALLTWLELALQPRGDSPVRDLAALEDGLLLVQLRDGSAWTIRVCPGVPSGDEAA